MKKILITAGIVAAAGAGVYWYMRNRNKTSEAMHDLADKAGDVHEKVKKYFRKANHQAKRDFEDAIA
ncbi:hypothetical protein [Sediminibacterium soli]|uniref:hypothetical protein n=1 Tax=Sediminibacterium soli TaxID=2698829 RepID=UPI00137B4893|nr:hypothetical protein [Sediminibacterium soli]NCI48202.1 hypothetical protein [Sediminibacterium soli]